MRKEFNDIRNRVKKCTNLHANAIDAVLNIIDDVEEEYLKRSINHTLLNSTVKDLVFAKKSTPSPIVLYSIDKVIKMLKNIQDYSWCPIEPGCSLPEECTMVDVTIMERDANNPCIYTVSTDTAWIQEGRWVIKRNSENTQVIAWKYPAKPYIPETIITTKPASLVTAGGEING